MVINALVRFEGPLDCALLEEVLQRRLICTHPKFAMLVRDARLPLMGSMPALGPLAAIGPTWERDPLFALDRHVHRLALPSPQDERALRALVGDLVSVPLPEDRPPWQTHLIECDAGSTAMLVRMHHCIADGIALAEVLLSLTDGEDGVEARRPASKDEANRAASGSVGTLAHALSRLANESLRSLLHPGRPLRIARSCAREVELLTRVLARPADSASALKGPLSGIRRVGCCTPIPLEQVKEIAHRHEATVNDVLLAAVTGAFRQHVRSHDGAGGRSGRVSSRTTAVVPVNLRPRGEPLPPDLGNRFGLSFLELPVLEADRGRRLAIVKRRMDKIKRSPEGPLTYAVLQALGAVPPEIESRLVNLFSAKSTAVVTNVPGPARPRSLAGARMRDLAIWAPASGSMGMSVSMFSYRGEVTVGLLSDVAVLEDPQTAAEHVAQEIDALGRCSRRGRRRNEDGALRATADPSRAILARAPARPA